MTLVWRFLELVLFKIICESMGIPTWLFLGTLLIGLIIGVAVVRKA